MITWHIGRKSELTKVPKEKQTHKDSVCEYVSEWYEGTASGQTEHTTNIAISKDGSVSFFDDNSEGSTYLYPEQVEHLKKILSEVKK